MFWRVKISVLVLSVVAIAPAFGETSRVALRESREAAMGSTVRATAVQPAAMAVYRQPQVETARVAPPQPAGAMPAFVGVGSTRATSDREAATPARQAVYQSLSTRGARTAAAVSETTVTQVQPVDAVQIEPAQPAQLAGHSRVSVGVGIGYSSGYHGGTAVGVGVRYGYPSYGYYGGGYYGGGYCGPRYYRPAYYYAPRVYYPGPCYYPGYYGYSGYYGSRWGVSFGFRGCW